MGASGSGFALSDISDEVASSYTIRAHNETGSAINAGTPVDFVASGAGKSITVSSQNRLVDGILPEKIEDGESGRVLIVGDVVDYTGDIYSGSGINPIPMSQNTELYYDFNNSRWTDVEISEVPMGFVVMADYFYAQAGALITGDITIDTIGELTTHLGRTNRAINSPVITLPSIGEGNPLDLEIEDGEGFAFVIDSIGVIDIAVPVGQGFLNANGSDRAGATYRITSSGGTSPEGVWVYREGDDWRLDVLNSGLTTTTINFNASRRNDELLKIEGQYSNVVSSPAESDTLSLTQLNTLYRVSTDDDDKVVSFVDTSSYEIPSGKASKIWVSNEDDNWLRVETHSSSVNFANIQSHYFVMKPGEVRQFVIESTKITPVGEISYEFEAVGPSAFTGSISSWAISNFHSDVADIPSGNTDRIRFHIPGQAIINFQTNINWFGSTSEITISGTSIWDNTFDNVAIHTNKNGTLASSSQSQSLPKINDWHEALNETLLPQEIVVDDYLSFSGTNFSSGARGLSPKVRIKYIIKATD